MLPAQAVGLHADPAQFDGHRTTPGQLGHRSPPLGAHFRPAAGVASRSQRPAQVVDHDRQLRKSPGQVGDLGKLGVVDPGVEPVAQTGEHADPLPEVGPSEQTGRGEMALAAARPVGVPGGAVPDPPESAAPGPLVGHQDLLDGPAEHEIGEGDDAGDPGSAPVGTGRGLVGRIDRLADRPERLGTVGPVGAAALDEDRGLDPVPAARVLPQLGELVAVAGQVPQVVMGVADGQVGLDRLLHGPSQPVPPPVEHGSTLVSRRLPCRRDPGRGRRAPPGGWRAV